MGSNPALSPLISSVKAQICAILWLITSRAFGAVIPGDISIVNGLPTPDMTQLQDAFNFSISANPTYHCTQRKEWVPDSKGYEITDCFNARVKYWKNKVATHPEGEEIEYIDWGATPTTLLATMRTPRRWTSGSCTIAIAMRTYFDPGELPDDHSRQYHRPTDIATYKDANAAFLSILLGCRHVGASGWDPFGHNDNIGAFVWKTGSAMDRELSSAIAAYELAHNISSDASTV